jgi:hypothetical protein
MRILAFAAALLLACASSTVAAEAAPAANVTYGKKALAVVNPAVTTAQAAHDTAKTAGGLLGGDKAKAKVESTKASLDTAKALQSDLALVAEGKAPAADGLIAGLQADSAKKPSTMDKLKALPGVETVTAVLATPGVPEALLSMAPLDKIPGLPAGAAALLAP